MKIVIDITEDDFEKIKNTSFVENTERMFHQSSEDRKGTMMLFRVMNAIKDGTPLPEHHGRLIDADELKRTMEKDVRRALSFVDLTDFVWLAPTIIEGSDKE